MSVDIEVFVSEGRDADLVRFLSEVCKLTTRCRVVVGDAARPKLRTDSIEVEGLSTVCRQLVLLNSTFPCRQLLGSTPEDAAQVESNSFWMWNHF